MVGHSLYSLDLVALRRHELDELRECQQQRQCQQQQRVQLEWRSPDFMSLPYV